MLKVVSSFLKICGAEEFALAKKVLASGLTLFFVSGCGWAQTIEEAQRYEAAGNWPDAARTWESLAKAQPGDYRLWTSMGAALAHQERFAAAIAAYKKAKAIAPRDPQTNFNLGLACFKTNRLPEAVAPFRIAAETMPGRPQIDLLLGMSLYGSGSFKEAATWLKRAREEGGPSTAEFRQVLAQCYLQTKQSEEAKRELTDLLRSNPESASAHMLLGEAEDASGHSDAAKQQFREAIAADPRLPDVHFGLGYLLWKDRAYDEAEAELRKEVQLDAQHAAALTYLGDVLIKRGEKTEAGECLLAAQKLDARLWLTSLDLGILAADEKNWHAAATHFQRAAELGPNRAEPHYRLAQAFKAQGQAVKAAEELRKVQALHKQQEDDLVGKISGPKAVQ